MNAKDIKIGMRFGRIVVIDLPEKLIQLNYVNGKCDCGMIKKFRIEKLIHEITFSCGCMRYFICGYSKKTHNYRSRHADPLKRKAYKAWVSMRERCLNPKDKKYKFYGGRGITIYSEWINSFELFLAYIGDPPTITHTIDRINSDGNYEPGNIKWSTYTEQNNNRSINRPIEYNGRIQNLSQWEKEYGLSRSVLAGRLRLGWDIYRALTTPVGKY